LAKFPFRDESLPVNERIDDLIGRLTLEEKAQFFHINQEAVERLDIPEFCICAEGAHGFMHRTRPSTTFPQTIGLAASWDKRLLAEIGEVIGREARAFHMDSGRTNYASLWFPTIDLERNPLWGRNEEGYGEDPVLTGKLCYEAVTAAQGSDDFYVQVSCAPKHFMGNNNEKDRHCCSCSIDARNMHEYYLRPFKAIMGDAKACSIMTSYNEVNGIPMVIHPLVRDFIKGECKLSERGHCVTDSTDFFEISSIHRSFDTHEESFAEMLRMGGDVINEPQHEPSVETVVSAVRKGIVSEETLDEHLRQILLLRFKYGIYDEPESCPYNRYTMDDVLTDDAIALTRRAVAQSAVLLKNDNGALPIIPEKTKKIAVFGQLARDVLADWYTSVMKYTVSPLEGLGARYGEDKIEFVECRDTVTLETLDGRPLVIKGDYCGLAAAQCGETAARFLRDDWGYGVNTLTFEENGLMLDTGFDLIPDLRPTEEEKAAQERVKELYPVHALGKTSLRWIPSTQFNIIDCGDGTVCIRTWDDQYLALSADSEYIMIERTSTPCDAHKFRITTDDSWKENAVRAAKESDAAIVFGGSNPMFSAREETDRSSIALADCLDELVGLIGGANDRTLFCLVTSYPYAIGRTAEKCAAVLTLPHGMQEMGNGLADIISGDVSPSAKLPQTWYSDDSQLFDIMDYDVIGSGQTYRYFEGKPLYPFGYGLSYSSFEYSNISLSAQSIGDGEKIEVSFDLKNTGDYRAAEVAQLYTRFDGSRVKRPLKALCDFDRVELDPGQSVRVTLTLDADELRIWDVTSDSFVLEKGTCRIMVGSSSEDTRLVSEIAVDGTVIGPRSFAREVLVSNYDSTSGTYLGRKQGCDDPAVFALEGACVTFEKVDCSTLPSVMRASVYAPRAGCRLTLSCDGEVIAEKILPNTGSIAFHGRYIKPCAASLQLASWVDVVFPVTKTSGVHDITLSISKECGIMSLSPEK